jgi:hypothetical protein
MCVGEAKMWEEKKRDVTDARGAFICETGIYLTANGWGVCDW